MRSFPSPDTSAILGAELHLLSPVVCLMLRCIALHCNVCTPMQVAALPAAVRDRSGPDLRSPPYRHSPLLSLQGTGNLVSSSPPGRRKSYTTLAASQDRQETTRFDERFGDDKSLVEAQTLAAGSPSESSSPGYSYMQQPHSATALVRAPIVWWREYLPCHSEIGVTGCPARNPAPRSTTSLGMNQQPANRSRYFLFSPGTPSLSRYVQFAIWAHSLWITARDF
ncbi:hypothetical protein CGCS363_v005146 [Colletotrichum siamense]|uniref:uncharacterized protein n=1 Tax=Colletotrichum siamense TaxID=690259 RepID=UPI00187305DA|nr:uncharacterized protein CGCS363_v005146 [Colletotrichum siamense]KAF5504916.1 hypothetical protein CGCS363_v005146 [Colletotrichum siamense]